MRATEDIVMSKEITHWMLAVGTFALLAGCSKDEASEPVEPGASEGNEAPPAMMETPTESTAVPAEPVPTTAPSEDNLNPPPASDDTSSTAAPLKDEEIVKITASVDAAEIEQAKLAKSKSKNAQVKKFATHMITQHTQSKQKGAKLAKSAKLTPSDSDLGGQLEGKAQSTLETLKSADAAGFDSAYMEAQVKQHQEVLDLLDRQLIPNAQNADLKAQLQTTREMVQQHLTQGQEIQQSLASTGGATAE
jgi:putative membrane protein